MTGRTIGTRIEGESNLSQQINRIDSTLDIMETHDSELYSAEADIQEQMRRNDREFKDSHLHSTPRSRKHQR